MDTCKNGHLRTPENTRYEDGPSGTRVRCVTCRQEAAKRRYAERNKNGDTNPAKEKVARYRKTTKEKVMSAYGGRCACCGETEPVFLTIDHVNGDGADHRMRIGNSRVYAWLVQQGFPEGFQVLCWNCNCGRQLNGGICPHTAEPPPAR